MIETLHEICWHVVLAHQSERGEWSPPMIGELWRRSLALQLIALLSEIGGEAK